jgi:UDP-N-acetylmuramate-alanine ligase
MSGLVKEIDHPDLIFIPELGQAFEHLHNELTEGDLVLVFTAGDAIEINDRLEKALSH